MIAFVFDKWNDLKNWLSSLFSNASPEGVRPDPGPVIIPDVPQAAPGEKALFSFGLTGDVPPGSSEVEFVTAALKTLNDKAKVENPHEKTCTCAVYGVAHDNRILRAKGIKQSACTGLQEAYSNLFKVRVE